MSCCNCETIWEMYSYFWTAKFVPTGKPYDISRNPPIISAGGDGGAGGCLFEWVWDDPISQRDIITPQTQTKAVLYKGPNSKCFCLNANGGSVVTNQLINSYPKTWPMTFARKRGHWQGIGPTAICKTYKTRPFGATAKIDVKKIGVEGIWEVKYKKGHPCGADCEPPAFGDPKIQPGPFDIEKIIDDNITTARYP